MIISRFNMLAPAAAIARCRASSVTRTNDSAIAKTMRLMIRRLSKNTVAPIRPMSTLVKKKKRSPKLLKKEKLLARCADRQSEHAFVGHVMNVIARGLTIYGKKSGDSQKDQPKIAAAETNFRPANALLCMCKSATFAA